ncbi:unnamed protein product [Prorocentrum cordatum]|uniref:Uncharacterized protein n=1 Tax=Prorocentrum cordatum TaxID=2364126 RepID=A0ABN9XLW1_9DINO|nr:unnamed protein product [Polarella glacialis]
MNAFSPPAAPPSWLSHHSPSHRAATPEPTHGWLDLIADGAALAVRPVSNDEEGAIVQGHTFCGASSLALFCGASSLALGGGIDAVTSGAGSLLGERAASCVVTGAGPRSARAARTWPHAVPVQSILSRAPVSACCAWRERRKS